MSHDRGCPCGRESYEYADCAEVNCYKTDKNTVYKETDQFFTELNEDWVSVFKKNTRPDGHGEPAVEKFLGNMAISKADAIIAENADNYDESYYIKHDPRKNKVKSRSQNKRDALVFIGRMQPFHNGHKSVIEQALLLAREVVVVLGSSFTARSLRNPFTFAERKAMIRAVFPSERVKVVGVSDYPLDDSKWVAAIQSLVDTAVPGARDIGLIGHSKDSSSYYLNIFPKWKRHVEVANVEGINATDIRNLFLRLPNTRWAGDFRLPDSVNTWLLHNFEAFDNLRTEYEMIKAYKQSWASAPYAPTLVTTDAVVAQSGHVLLIKRGRAPGKGLYALPGGFLNPKESIETCMIRELHEETKIKLQPQVLRGSIEAQIVVDTPDRDPRGRVITHAFYIKLKDQQDLPKVKLSRNPDDEEDDADEAKWHTFAEVLRMRDSFYADHFHILAHFLKIG